MRKQELENLTVGTVIQHKEKGTQFTITLVDERGVEVQGSNKLITTSSLKRWYTVVETAPEVIEDPVEIVMPEVVETVPAVEVVNTSVDIVTLAGIVKAAEHANCTIKKNSNHYAIKYNKKNIMEVYTNKKGVSSIAVRHTLFKPEELKQLGGKLVGNGTYTLDYKFTPQTMTQVVNTLTLGMLAV